MRPNEDQDRIQTETDLSEHVSITLKQDFTEHDKDGKPTVRFLRVEILNIYPAIESIISVIAETSWVSRLVDDSVKAGFITRAQPTIDKLSNDLNHAIENKLARNVGEYVVSMVAKYIIEAAFGHRALPLAEIIKEQISGNAGFDFHHEEDELILLFGEAKYVSGRNAYGSAFSQIVEHISLGKDIKELPDLRDFTSEQARKNAVDGKKGYSAAFSTSRKTFDSDELIQGIKANKDFTALVKHETLLIIAVDIND